MLFSVSGSSIIIQKQYLGESRSALRPPPYLGPHRSQKHYELSSSLLCQCRSKPSSPSLDFLSISHQPFWHFGCSSSVETRGLPLLVFTTRTMIDAVTLRHLTLLQAFLGINLPGNFLCVFYHEPLFECTRITLLPSMSYYMARVFILARIETPSVCSWGKVDCEPYGSS
jgi:hypothetical protein